MGDTQRQDEALAFDVDGDVDAEALDSDDEAEGNDELGIDAEETDGTFSVHHSQRFRSRRDSPYAHRSIVRATVQRKANTHRHLG